ncbi:MAG: hypothetical protein J5621_00930 [Paludibacteraceae bacterium]|nr:hypothetical protein [Paludibacteraceae bacterium]
MKVRVLSQINMFIVFLLGVMGVCVSCKPKYGCPEPVEKYGCPMDTSIKPMYGVQMPDLEVLATDEDNNE